MVGVDGARIKYTYPSADHEAMMMQMVMKLLLHDSETIVRCVTEVKPPASNRPPTELFNKPSLRTSGTPHLSSKSLSA